MKAAIHFEHGPVDVLQVVDVPEPKCAEHDVLVRVRAVGLNRLDVLQREGPPLLPHFGLPHIPGMDVAGEVVAVGREVDQVRAGDRVVVNPALHCGICHACLSGDDAMCPNVRVIGGNHPGGYAEWCVVPATHVYRIPDDVSYIEAASIPTNYSTAWHAIVVVGKLHIGETVLIHGAGSGVSLAGIQIAKRCGARVIATSRSDEKLEVARRVGADVVVNHRTGDLVGAVKGATDGVGVDMVFDHVGPELFQQSLVAMRPRGRMVFCGTTTGVQASFNLPHAYHFGMSLLGADPYGYAEFVQMLEYYWTARFTPVVDSVYPLAEAREAQRRMESGEFIGKILLEP